jgi:predicted amidohydrolase
MSPQANPHSQKLASPNGQLRANPDGEETSMKVAAVQMDVQILEKLHNLEKILAKLETAAKAGAGIVIFPECALSGYCYSNVEEAAPAAEEVPGPSTEQIQAACARLNCTAVVGMLEQSAGRLFNAAAVITPQTILGTHRKVHLLCLGIDRYDYPSDKPFQVFSTPHGKIGVNICFDCSFPESGRVLKLLGAQLLAIPTNWPLASDSWHHTIPVRAVENHFHVVAADRVGEERGFKFAGRSQISDFMGNKVVEAGEIEETIIYADLDLAAADDNRVIRVPGEYEFDRIAARRPGMYKLITEEKR